MMRFMWNCLVLLIFHIPFFLIKLARDVLWKNDQPDLTICLGWSIFHNALQGNGQAAKCNFVITKIQNSAKTQKLKLGRGWFMNFELWIFNLEFWTLLASITYLLPNFRNHISAATATELWISNSASYHYSVNNKNQISKFVFWRLRATII